MYGLLLAPVAETSATDLLRTKSWDISLDCHIGKYRGVIRSNIVFLESVTFQSHVRIPGPACSA